MTTLGPDCGTASRIHPDAWSCVEDRHESGVRGEDPARRRHLDPWRDSELHNREMDAAVANDRAIHRTRALRNSSLDDTR
jgi:hypothetical protein